MAFRRGFMKNWFAVEALPIWVIVGSVTVGASWYLTRLARGPTIIWTKENPTPWNDIKPDEGTKILTVNQTFDKSSSALCSVAAFNHKCNPTFCSGTSGPHGKPENLKISLNDGPAQSFFVDDDFHRSSMVVALDSPQPTFILPPLEEIPDEDEDKPKTGQPLGKLGSLQLPEIIFGAASFSPFYNQDDHLASTTPLRTIRLALRYGVSAFDTSAFYGASEIVLGTALKTLEPEFPRSSYQLMTKCGRYGPQKEHFDYSPAGVRAGVNRSLSRLNTTYLDTVYLHDVEFVCTAVQPQDCGNHTLALSSEKMEYGFQEGDEGKVHGEGDRIILNAIAELRQMKSEGLIKNIGITGYPLPVLLRIALLVLHTPPYQPLDVLLSYSHLNLQNSTLEAFLPEFRQRARITHILAASPINMGLLTSSPPAWHPAPPPLREASKQANETCNNERWEGGLPNIALGFAYKKAKDLDVPTVVGLSQLREVHENIRVWRELDLEDQNAAKKRAACEQSVLEDFKEVQGWSWVSP